jgi:hypothetical protein
MSPTVRKDCPCPRTTCKRHTLCDECEAARKAQGRVPFCKLPAIPLWERITKRFRGAG